MSLYYVDINGIDSPSRDGAKGKEFASIAYALSRSSFGDTIHLNKGTYNVNSTLSIPSGVSIEGDGASSIIKFINTNKYNVALKLASEIEGTEGNQSISYLRLDGNKKGWAPVYQFARSNVKYHHLTVTNFVTQGLYIYGKTDGSAGIPNKYSTGNEIYNCIITDCATYNTGGYYGYGNIAFGGQDGLKIYNNIITATGKSSNLNGVGIKAVNGNGNNIGCKIFNNNIFTDMSTVGANSYNFAIETWNNQGLEIYGNNIFGTIDLGGYTCNKGNYKYSAYVHDNFIGSNSILNNDKIGIIIEGAIENSDIVIEKNKFKYLNRSIIFYQSEKAKYNNIKIYNNRFEDCGYKASGYNNTYAITWNSSHVGWTIKNLKVRNNIFISIQNSQLKTLAAMLIPSKLGCNVDSIYFTGNKIKGFSTAPIYGSSSGKVTNFYYENNTLFENGNNNNPVLPIMPEPMTNKNNIVKQFKVNKYTSKYLNEININ